MSEPLGETSVERNGRGNHNREKQFEPLHPARSREHGENGVAQTSSGRSTRSSLERACSISDGYSHHAVDRDTLQEPSEIEKAYHVPGEEEFLVKWDGPSDPGNPRNMRLARKWAIVLVLSLGSICV